MQEPGIQSADADAPEHPPPPPGLLQSLARSIFATHPHTQRTLRGKLSLPGLAGFAQDQAPRLPSQVRETPPFLLQPEQFFVAWGAPAARRAPHTQPPRRG